MKKRILSFILALVMMCTLLLQSIMIASAVGYNVVNVNGVTGDDIVAQARKYLGVPFDTSGGDYKCRTGYGSTMMFDCSGFVYRVCRDLEIVSTQPSEGTNGNGYYYITANTYHQKNYGESLTNEVSNYLANDDLSGFLPGDLIFFDYGSDNVTDHVGIYSGNGKVINATKSRGIYETPLSQKGWPEGTLGTSLYAAVRLVGYCEHNYNNLGICQSTCKGEFNWQATFDSNSAGIYKVTLDGGIYLRTDKPYSASTAKSKLIKEDTMVKVLGSVTNHYPKEWYKVSYNGVIGYTSKDNLTKHTHSYGSWVTTKAAGCTTTGTKKKTCSSCGDVQTQTIAATGHSYGSWVTTKAAGCTTEGTKKKTCSSCGDVQTQTIAATGHSYGSWVTTKAAGCTTTGTKKKTCSSCGDVQTQTIAATGHSYGSWVTTKAAGCTTTGKKKQTCSSCGNVVTAPIPSTGHSYGSWVTTKAAGCTTTGTKKKTCSSCGDVQTQTIAATGHSYGSWVTTKAAGCTTEGTKKKTCSSCGDVQTLFIIATGHSYQSTVIDATCSDYEKIRYTCSKCQDCYEEYTNGNRELGDHLWGKIQPIFGVEGEQICLLCGKKFGDVNNDSAMTTDDVMALLLHISMPDMFPLPVGVSADFTGDSVVTTDDAVRLLLHISMPDMFPL